MREEKREIWGEVEARMIKGECFAEVRRRTWKWEREEREGGGRVFGAGRGEVARPNAAPGAQGT